MPAFVSQYIGVETKGHLLPCGRIFKEKSSSEWISMSPHLEINPEGRNAAWIPAAISVRSQKLWTLGEKCEHHVDMVLKTLFHTGGCGSGSTSPWICVKTSEQRTRMDASPWVQRIRQELRREQPPWHPVLGRPRGQEGVRTLLKS